MQVQEKHLVMPLLVAAVFANFLLFGVAYTNASFSGTQQSLPTQTFAQLTAPLDQVIDTAQSNLAWAVGTVSSMVKPEVVAFLGLQDYKFGQPRYTALKPNSSSVVDSTSTGQVLGISITNPAYVGVAVASQPSMSEQVNAPVVVAHQLSVVPSQVYGMAYYSQVAP